jgi:hypothetical protein
MPATPQQALSRCVHCAADLTKIPMLGWVHPNGQQIARTTNGEGDHVAMPVGLVRGVPERLGIRV